MIENQPTWKHDLLAKFQKSLEELPDELDSLSSPTPSEETSIYEIYEQLAAMRNEMRKVNRRTADALGAFEDVLDGMRDDSSKIREQVLKNPQAKSESGMGSRKLALTLIDLLDRVQRMESSARIQNDKGWLSAFSARDYLQKQLGALAILTDHTRKLLLNLQVSPIAITMGEPFNPNTMKAAGSSDSSVGAVNVKAGQTSTLVVTEEVLPGYTLGEHCLRVAEVILSQKKSNE